MTWLVTGGAGYIGAHVVVALRDGGESCGEELVARYRRTLDEYADLYRVARD